MDPSKKQSGQPHKASPKSKITSSPSSARLVWVKSVQKSPSLTSASSPEVSKTTDTVTVVTAETIKESEMAFPSSLSIEQVLVDSIKDSPGSPQLFRIKSQYNKSAGSSSSRAVKSVWMECVKIQPELTKTIQMEPVKEDTPPSSSSSDSDEHEKESQNKPPREKQKIRLPVYQIPKHLMDLIEMDKVPEVLTMPLTLSTYADYFATLLYAEDFYIEKWSNFLLYRVTLELDEKQMKKERKKKNMIDGTQKNEKVYLSFEITSIPMRRPYLLSRDFVFVRRSGKKSKHFEGRLIRVLKSTRVLAEFGDDFLLQYSPSHKYDVSFSFNRTCLKRSHQAVEAALNPLFQNILFPPPVTPSHQDLDHDQVSVIRRILSLRGPPPYLIKGPLSITKQKSLSIVGTTVSEAILQIYRYSPYCRILVTAPKNLTCDTLIKSLNEVIPDSELFRANATFREIEDVPDDILPMCSYDGECFSDMSLSDLRAFKVIVSTSMTSFRLNSSGITAGHFTHIFMVDASSATEPENMVALANLVGEETSIVITGLLRNHPDRVRSDIARKNGLRRSYFHRLLESEPYSSNDPEFICDLG